MEDLRPYMIPDLSGIGTRRKYAPGAETGSGLSGYLLKSEPTDMDGSKGKELQELLSKTNARYLANFKVDSRIPYDMRHGFDRDMELFSQNLSGNISDTYVKAVGKRGVTSKSLVEAYAEVRSGLNTLSAKLDRYDREFATWLALQSVQREGYTRCLFISEQGAATCDRCAAYHGRVYSLSDVPIPPLHPNCRCELVVMDARTEALYHINEQAFIERFRQVRRGPEGGIYLLDHETFPFGITSENLSRIPLPSEHMIVDLSRPNGMEGGSKFNLAETAASYFSELADDAKDLITYLLNAQSERGERKWDSLGSFMDWLTLGIVSGMWRGAVSNYEAMVSDPSLYNIVNFITLGTLDSISGALAPEDPWSLEHWLDIIGTILTVYGAYKTAVNVKEVLTGSADDALRAGGTLADDVDDIVRNAGLTQAQIDDIIKIPQGQRPDPTTYLTREYIDQHLDMFRGGVTKFYAKAPSGTVGPREGTFVMPSSIADDLIRQADGDVRVLEELLGFDPGYLGNSPVRIDISDPSGLRIPSGNELGANEYWIPGGYTSGGMPEAIIDQPQPGDYTVSPAFSK